jgi:hypothetical protein
VKWWWIPGAVVIAIGAMLVGGALMEPAQPLRAFVVLVELVGAFAVVLVGAALLHGGEALRDRSAARGRGDAQLPRAISRRARGLRRRP